MNNYFLVWIWFSFSHQAIKTIKTAAVWDAKIKINPSKTMFFSFISILSYSRCLVNLFGWTPVVSWTCVMVKAPRSEFTTLSNQADSPSCWTESSWLIPELCFIHHTVGSRQCTWFCDCTVILLFLNHLLCCVLCICSSCVYSAQDWFSAHNKPTHPLYDRHKLPRCSLWATEHMIVMIVRRCRR